MVKEKKTKVNNKIASRNIILNKIQANRESRDLLVKESKNVVTIGMESKCKIIEHTEEKLIFEISINIGILPKAIFQISLEYRIECKLEEPIELVTLVEINDIMSGFGSDVSFMIADLTNKLLEKPFILPPKFEIEEMIS